MATLTRGNPYTHYEETRHSIAGRDVYGGCDWCGKTPRVLYRWGTERKFGNMSWRWFCNKECRDAFS